jgi:hypothetical protein
MQMPHTKQRSSTNNAILIYTRPTAIHTDACGPTQY